MGEKKRRQEAAYQGKGSTIRPAHNFRLTWRGVVLFLGAMVLLDAVFYAVFRFGFDSCYAIFCLLE